MEIEGLKLRIQGTELAEMFRKLEARALKKADETAAKMAVLEKAGEDYKEIAGYSNSGGTSRLAELRETKKMLEMSARKSAFISSHLSAHDIYILEARDFPESGGIRMGRFGDADLDFFEE